MSSSKPAHAASVAAGEEERSHEGLWDALRADVIHGHSVGHVADVSALWDVRALHGVLDPIERIKYPEDQARFEECVSSGTACIIQGVPSTDSWRAESRWASAEAMCSHYGNLRMELAPGLTLTLEEYLLQYLAGEANGAAYPWYLKGIRFDRFAALSAGHASMLDDWTTPRWFDDDVYDRAGMGGSFTYLLIGGRRSGTNLHIDPLGTCGWNTLTCGHKRWVFFPPEPPESLRSSLLATRPARPCLAHRLEDAITTCELVHDESDDALRRYADLLGVPPIGTEGVLPVTDWFTKLYPSLKARQKELGMVECIQGPGETVFVPAGWYHAVLNLDVTIAVSRNHMLPSMLSAALVGLDATSPLFGRMLRKELGIEQPSAHAAMAAAAPPAPREMLPTVSAEDNDSSDGSCYWREDGDYSSASDVE